MATNERLQFKMVTPVETVFAQEVDQVLVPTEDGVITVLPNHTMLVSILAAGELIVTDGDTETALAVSGGVVEISENQLIILADSAEQPSEIDIQEAEERAQALAKELESETSMDMTTYSMLQKQLAVEQAKLHVASKWRK